MNVSVFFFFSHGIKQPFLIVVALGFLIIFLNDIIRVPELGAFSFIAVHVSANMMNMNSY